MQQIIQIMNSGSILGLFLEVVPITLLVGVAYALWRFIRIKKSGLSFSWGTEIIRWLFVCYLTGLVNLVLVPSNLWSHFWFYVRNGYATGDGLGWFSGGFNLVPSLYKCLIGELELGSWVQIMLVGNILMYAPMGFFLPFVSKKMDKGSLLKLAVAIPVVVEVLQPIVGRSFDVDDLICNFVGIVFGYAVAVAVVCLMKKMKK